MANDKARKVFNLIHGGFTFHRGGVAGENQTGTVPTIAESRGARPRGVVGRFLMRQHCKYRRKTHAQASTKSRLEYFFGSKMDKGNGRKHKAEMISPTASNSRHERALFDLEGDWEIGQMPDPVAVEV